MTTHRNGPARSEAARVAILQATAQLFAERGYARLTIEGVATLAGVGKQTIYRWWKSKGALLADCLLEGLILPDRLALPDTGNIHADLSAWLTTIVEILNREDGEGLLLPLAAAATDSTEVGIRLRDTILQGGMLSGRLAAAAGTASNLYPGAPFDEIAEALVGSLVLRVIGRAPAGREEMASLIEAVIGRPLTSG